MGKPAEGASLEIGQKFQDLVATLEHAQVEFDLGCEHIFRDERIRCATASSLWAIARTARS
ncbi:MAG: hypothetical protein ACLR8Y_16865 [Alistipes indistinctus]